MRNKNNIAYITSSYAIQINGIKPQGKPWTQNSDASIGEFTTSFSSSEAERGGGLKKIQ